jgi:hypothetical protein
MTSRRASARGDRQQAAAQLVSCYEALAQRNANLLQQVVAGNAFECWRKYPSADAIDSRSGFQYFYHAHSPDDRPDGLENGHFHTFARLDRCAHGVDDWDIPSSTRDAMTASESWDADSAHLVAISVNARGLPIEIFTVNQWVTGDRWCRGASLARVATGFDVSLAAGPPLVAAWLKAFFTLYKIEIRDLLLERDANIQRALARHDPGYGITEDRSLEILSSKKLSFSDDVEAA